MTRRPNFSGLFVAVPILMILVSSFLQGTVYAAERDVVRPLIEQECFAPSGHIETGILFEGVHGQAQSRLQSAACVAPNALRMERQRFAQSKCCCKLPGYKGCAKNFSASKCEDLGGTCK